MKRLLGTEGNYGEQLGLTKDWAYRIIKHVGNYGEVFEKNVGQGSPLKIARGVNGCGPRAACNTPRRSAERPQFQRTGPGGMPPGLSFWQKACMPLTGELT